MVSLLLVVPVSSISGPARLARYIGTIGSMQGVAKETNPALKAAHIEILLSNIYPITRITTNCLMLNYSRSNSKLCNEILLCYTKEKDDVARRKL